MDRVNEKNTAWLTVDCFDRDSQAAAPTGLTYRIDCLTTGQVVKTDTVLTPSASVEITLTPTDNTLQNTANKSETRRVTVTADYGVDDQLISQFEYEVKNLSGVA